VDHKNVQTQGNVYFIELRLYVLVWDTVSGLQVKWCCNGPIPNTVQSTRELHHKVLIRNLNQHV